MIEYDICSQCKGKFLKGTAASWGSNICFRCQDPLERIYRLMFDTAREESHAWIQWKGTEVCADIHCQYCDGGHIDASFAYFVRCRCGRVYAMDGHIKLIELTEEEKQHLPPAVVDVT